MMLHHNLYWCSNYTELMVHIVAANVIMCH